MTREEKIELLVRTFEHVCALLGKMMLGIGDSRKN